MSLAGCLAHGTPLVNGGYYYYYLKMEQAGSPGEGSGRGWTVAGGSFALAQVSLGSLLNADFMMTPSLCSDEFLILSLWLGSRGQTLTQQMIC